MVHSVFIFSSIISKKYGQEKVAIFLQRILWLLKSLILTIYSGEWRFVSPAFCIFRTKFINRN